MLAALKEPIEVEMVGGGVDALGLLGPALIAVTAIFAAILAAKTANRRQREQLKHDRGVRDRDRFRDTLDSVLESATGCIRELTHFSARTSVGDKQRKKAEASDGPSPELEAELATLTQELSRAEDTTHALTLEMWSNTLRLQLRLSGDHPVTARHEELAEACRTWYDVLAEIGSEPRTADEIAAEEEAMKAATGAFSAFMVVAQKTFADVA